MGPTGRWQAHEIVSLLLQFVLVPGKPQGGGAISSLRIDSSAPAQSGYGGDCYRPYFLPDIEHYRRTPYSDHTKHCSEYPAQYALLENSFPQGCRRLPHTTQVSQLLAFHITVTVRAEYTIRYYQYLSVTVKVILAQHNVLKVNVCRNTYNSF